MKITDISPTKKGKYALFVEGRFLFSVDGDTLRAHSVGVGKDLSAEKLEEIRRDAEYRYAKDRCLSLLGQRAYTRKQLMDKLDTVEEDIAALAVDRMEELGLVDDGAYARACSRDLSRLKGFAPARIARELAGRGIDGELIEQALEELDFDPEREIAKIVLRRFIRGIGEEKGYRRAVNTLVRMGYRYGDICRVLANLREDAGYYDEETEL